MPEADASSARRKKPRHRSGPAPGREWRHVQRPLEIRSVSETDGTIVLEGSPIVYGAPYTVFDMFGEFTETMHPGVATNVLAAGADIRFLFNHDGLPLARTTNGTLEVTDAVDKLTIRVLMDARSQTAQDLAVAIERRDVDQMSCGFVVAMDTWNDDYTQRDVYRFESLFDFSAVTYPASPTTSIELALRSMMAAPIESRARVRVAWKAAQELRAGKVLSAENAGLLQQALDALHEADDVDIPSIMSSLQTIDDALDAGQAGLAAVLGKANPDDDEAEEKGADMEDGTAGTSNVAPPGLTDGTGSRAVPETVGERRDASRSFNDIQRAVNDALKAQYKSNDDDYCDLWLEDCGDTWVVFHSWEQDPGVGLWRQSYALDENGAATLADDLVQVVEQTSYEPVAPVAPEPVQRSRNVSLELEAEQLKLRRRHVIV